VRRAFTLSCSAGAIGLIVLAVATVVPQYLVGYLLIALVMSAMIPATNTLIAANVPRSRRGTGFGIAASAQAISFGVGPAGAALFAAISLDLGFVLLAGLLLSLGVFLYVALREPDLERVTA
jgi:MFS family permease